MKTCLSISSKIIYVYYGSRYLLASSSINVGEVGFSSGVYNLVRNTDKQQTIAVCWRYPRDDLCEVLWEPLLRTYNQSSKSRVRLPIGRDISSVNQKN